MPGEKEPMGTNCGALVWPLTVTCIVAEVIPANSCGISTLSCCGNAEKIGTGLATPLNVTLAPASELMSFPSAPKDEKASIDPSSRLTPKTAAIVPGARGVDPVAK